MSRIGTILTDLKAELAALFPSHSQLSNPYSVAENTEGALRQGWGFRPSAGLNAKRNISCKLSIDRDIVILLTRQVFAGELDVDSKDAADRLLLEDHFTLIKNFEEKTEFSQVAAMDYISDVTVSREKSASCDAPALPTATACFSKLSANQAMDFKNKDKQQEISNSSISAGEMDGRMMAPVKVRTNFSETAFLQVWRTRN